MSDTRLNDRTYLPQGQVKCVLKEVRNIFILRWPAFHQQKKVLDDNLSLHETSSSLLGTTRLGYITKSKDIVLRRWQVLNLKSWSDDDFAI